MNQLEEIKCPFYVKTTSHASGKGQYPRRIVCEGCIEGSASIVCFPHLEDYLRFKVKFCESIENCVYCPYYLIASMKYGV